MNVKLIIAMHKLWEIPKGDIYLPVFVGAQGKDDICIDGKAILRDDFGENISGKNPNYCELTGLYFAWKNVDADAVGLVHYRRHFSNKGWLYRKTHKPFECTLSDEEAIKLMSEYDIVVPKLRNYYIESLYSHYANTHDAKHLDLTREIIAECFPEMLPYLLRAYDSKKGHMFNMCILKRELLDEYCRFIFDVLKELENRVDVTGLSSFDARLFGRVSEIIFNAWILQKRDEGVSIKEIPYIHMEKVNWIKKGMNFLGAKFGGRKYTKSA